jgi:DNA-binding response OmpR family regulator
MVLKALIIDDDASMTELLGLLLRSHGIEIIPCNTGNQGIELARTEKPDIIILDLMMPGIDGWEVCRTLRTFTKTPIAILSALDDPAIISTALDAGADDYMVKPIPSNVLIAHINTLTRRHKAENNASVLMQGTNSFDNPDSRNWQSKPLQA